MKKRNKHNKYLLLLASLALVVTAVIGTTLAYLVSSPPAVTNTFTPGKIESEIHENLSNKTKSNVTVKNTGNADAYIRAKVVISWQDADGNVLAEQPVKDKDYIITGSPAKGWFKCETDGFFYWISKVVPKGETGVLIQELEQKTEKKGYDLHVEILSEAIQAEPADAVEGAWGVTVADNGTISK